MTNLIVDGFAAYGTGTLHANDDVIGTNMLAGAWAEIPYFLSGSEISPLPWDTTSDDLYINNDMRGADDGSTWRRVLPAAEGTVILSFYYAPAELPSNVRAILCDWRTGTNTVIAQLQILSTGGMSIANSAGSDLAATSGPVLVAATAHHIECLITPASGVFSLYVNGQEVLNSTGLVFSSAGDVAQCGFLPQLGGIGVHDSDVRQYISHLIVRNTDGTTNNAITGDRRVATLFPNFDDPVNQGWTPQPLHKFGVGILNLSATGAFVTAEKSVATDIGTNDFTIEAEYRFQTLPTAGNKAVLFGKWDSTADQRSYQLYKGGPDLENGLTVFRTSTDGLNGSVVEKLKVAWDPIPGIYYHIAMCRDAGDLKLFIDGVQYGQDVADGDSYFAANAYPAIGSQTNNITSVAGTRFDGWSDEIRFTKGLSRYSANFTPPAAAFPRNGDDPNWGAVVWLSSWDNAVVDDDGPLNLALVARGGAAAITPNDGEFAYQTINKPIPNNDTFIEAALLPAAGVLTFTGQPANTETVTLGTTDGATPAVYKFVTALAAPFDVLIGATIADSIANLAAAIVAGAGAGTVYGTSTTANADVTSIVLPANQLQAVALTPGTSGNTIASTTTVANAAWAATTLEGGQDIPDFSQFGFERMPSNTVTVDSITLVGKQWKIDSGTASTQISLVGGGATVANGAERPVPATPSLTFDTFEEDPDTAGPLTPTTVLNSKVRIDRTV